MGKRLTIDEFVEKSRQIHGNKYDYSKSKYVNAKTKVLIICPEHGEFWQTPGNHIQGQGCPKCGGTKKITANEFIEKANEIHNDKYDYSKVNYANNHTKVCIICHEHGEFWQTPGNHIQGQGCPHCNESKLEKYVCEKLIENSVNFVRQKKFEWLGKQSLDFYLPDYNVAIECQGIQHYQPVDFGGNGEEYAKNEFLRRIKRDKNKLEKVNKHSIKMIYVDENNKNNFLNEII